MPGRRRRVCALCAATGREGDRDGSRHCPCRVGPSRHVSLPFSLSLLLFFTHSQTHTHTHTHMHMHIHILTLSHHMCATPHTVTRRSTPVRLLLSSTSISSRQPRRTFPQQSPRTYVESLPLFFVTLLLLLIYHNYHEPEPDSLHFQLPSFNCFNTATTAITYVSHN